MMTVKAHIQSKIIREKNKYNHNKKMSENVLPTIKQKIIDFFDNWITKCETEMQNAEQEKNKLQNGLNSFSQSYDN